MIPYIAALIILIVVILYQVYAKTDSFAADASGNVMTVDASGNGVASNAIEGDLKISLSDLFGLLGPFKMDASGNPILTKVAQDASGNASSITAPAPAAVPSSALSAQEITDRLAKAVSKQVKDDLISQYSLDDIHNKYAPCDLTNSEAQGQEYARQQPQPLPSPQPDSSTCGQALSNTSSYGGGVDMSEYIRKDSIPCWNCAVP